MPSEDDRSVPAIVIPEPTLIPGSPATASLRLLLTELGESSRTGALHIGGVPGGVLYLVAGRITHAETAACPGIGERLVGSGRLSAAAWQTACAAGRGAHRVGRVLVRDGHLGENELACRVVAAICDATHQLLQSDDAPVHFVPGERHWLGVVTHLDLGALGHAVASRMLCDTRRPRSRGGRSRRRPGRAGHDAHRVRQLAAPWQQDGPR
jgi:hypothetical protein